MSKGEMMQDVRRIKEDVSERRQETETGSDRKLQIPTEDREP